MLAKPVVINLFHAMRVLRNYMVFWLGQTLSQIGSSITNFAIIIWVYEQTQSPLSVALLSVSIWVPKIIFGMIAGSVTDRINKKAVILLSDSLTAVLSIAIFLLVFANSLVVWQIYVFNILTGLFSCLQRNASEVVQTVIVPKRYYISAEGMRSFSFGAADLVAPLAGTTLYIIAGMKLVVIVDIGTFLWGFGRMCGREISAQ